MKKIIFWGILANILHVLQIVAAVGLILFAFTFVFNKCSENSSKIYILEGYSHAVGVCERGVDQPVKKITTIRKDVGTTWKESNVFFTVNGGHEEDPEVEVIRRNAIQYCAKYFRSRD